MLFDYRLDDHAKDKKIRYHLSKEKIYDTWSAILAFLGWVWELGQCYAYYAQITETELLTTVFHPLVGQSYSISKYEIVFMDRNESAVLLFLRCMVTVSTFFLLYCVSMRYYHVYERKVLEGDFYKKLMPGPKWTPRHHRLKNKLTGLLLLELFYLAIHSLPSVNANFKVGNLGHYLEYSLDLMIFVVMQGRIYLLIRLIKHYSPWFGRDADLVCKTQHAPGGYVFGCKALLKQMPIKFVLYLMIWTTLIGSIAMMLLEEPYQHTSLQDWGNYINAMWCGFNLMAQVGYGDLFPDTNAGRTAGLVVLLAGQFFTSLMIMVITNVAGLDPHEENAYHKIVEVLQHEAFLKANKDAIRYGVHYFFEVKIKKRYMSHLRLYTKLQLTLSQCRYLRRAKQLQEINRPFSFHLQLKKFHLNEKKYDVIRAIRKIETLADRLSSIEKKMDYIEEVTSSLHHSNSLIFQALEAVKEETTVERPFDGLIACPKALRHIDKLKKIKKLYWLAPTDPGVGVKDLQEGMSMVNLEQKLRRRLVRRITNAQTMVDKELINLTSDKTMPTLTFHDKRELVTIQNAKENLRRYVEQKKQRMDTLQPKKRNYVSGPQLMDKLRKKAHLVKLSMRMRTHAMQSLANTTTEEYYNNMIKKEDSSELETPSMTKSDQTSENPMGSTAATNPAHERRSVGAYDKYEKDKHVKDAMNVLNLLKEEDEDSVLDSDLDQEDEGESGSFQDTPQDSSNPDSVETRARAEDLPHKKSVLKMSKYGKTEPPKQEKPELNTQKSLLSFSPESQAIIFGDKRFSLTSDVFGKSEGEIIEIAKALGVITNNQGSLDDLGSTATLGEFKKILDELDPAQKRYHPVTGRTLRDFEYKRQTSRVERSPTTPNDSNPSPSRLERKISEFVLPDRDETNTNMTLITRETQENELFPRESDKEGSRYFAYPTDSTKRRETEDDNPNLEFGAREPLHRRGYEADSPGLQRYSTLKEGTPGRFSQYSGQILGLGGGLGNSKSNPSLALLQARKGTIYGASPKKFSTDIQGGGGSPLEFSPALRRKTIVLEKQDDISLGEQDQTFGRINLIKPNKDREESQTSMISELQTQQGEEVSLYKTRERGQSMWSFLKPN